MIAIEDYIDYTILRPDTSADEITGLCAVAVQEGFFAVCVPPVYVKTAIALLKHSTVAICSVVGFPLGYSDPALKIQEARTLIKDGADELDMVINLTNVRNQKWAAVASEIRTFCFLCRQMGIVSKIIIEITLLSEAEIQKICAICNEISPDFVKTSTGFTGISIVTQKEKVRLLREVLHEKISIKVSGGVRTHEEAMDFIKNYGVSRIGTSGNLKKSVEKPE